MELIAAIVEHGGLAVLAVVSIGLNVALLRYIDRMTTRSTAALLQSAIAKRDVANQLASICSRLDRLEQDARP